MPGVKSNYSNGWISRPVFYADVLSGSRMPNFVYMVVFADAASHDEHWKAFGSSPEWKTDFQQIRNTGMIFP